MTYDFDREIDRKNTFSIKWAFPERFGRPRDVLPLWVADMDFQAPPCVIEALKAQAEHGVFGYSDESEDYYDTVAAWFRERFGWETEREWLVKSPGVVFAVATAIQALTEEGDAVLIQPPVYYPFANMVRRNRRRLVENVLVYRDGRYSLDLEDLERKVREAQVKLFILCSPHNPVGRVWTREELAAMGEICARYGVYVVSDEIHCDFAFPEHPHTMFPLAFPEHPERMLVCTAPSKTFNLAGLQASHIFIPDAEVRKRFIAAMDRSGSGELNVMALTAAKAAYAGGVEWLEQCRSYLRGNLDFLREYLEERLPEIRLVEPEGTYFAWLDCSALGLGARELDALVTEKAKLWLDGGSMFGASGGQFQRVVLACTRKTLAQALERLERAVRSR